MNQVSFYFSQKSQMEHSYRIDPVISVYSSFTDGKNEIKVLFMHIPAIERPLEKGKLYI